MVGTSRQNTRMKTGDLQELKTEIIALRNCQKYKKT